MIRHWLIEMSGQQWRQVWMNWDKRSNKLLVLLRQCGVVTKLVRRKLKKIQLPLPVVFHSNRKRFQTLVFAVVKRQKSLYTGQRHIRDEKKPGVPGFFIFVL